MNRNEYLSWYMAGLESPPRPDASTQAAYAALADAITRDGQTTKAFGVGGWRPSPYADPYPGDRELRAAARDARERGIAFAVSDVEHNGASLGNRAQNLAFRAHHDAMHVVTGEPAFNLDGEIAVTLATVRRLRLPYTSDAATVLVAEIIGQSLYHARTGRFPLDASGRQPIPVVSARAAEVTDAVIRAVIRGAF